MGGILETTGLKVGKDFLLAYSPEREDPGRPGVTTNTIPKLVGGTCELSGKVAYELYRAAIASVHHVSTAEVAESAKLLENIFRAINIALVNEMKVILDAMDIDVWEVIDAAATKPFGFMKFTPGPGLGGHCIPVDPHYLSWKMRTLNYKTRFIELASEINSEMPIFVVGKVREGLNRMGKAVNGSRILVLGVAYKPDIDDVRESPALDIIHLLEADGAQVFYHDPFVPRLEEDGEVWESVPLTDEVVSGMDAAVIVTDHKAVDYRKVLSLTPMVVDTRNATRDLGGIPEVSNPGEWIVKGKKKA
jgi:UDP-N-acetyl-D-glucosamine dehydrogenase